MRPNWKNINKNFRNKRKVQTDAESTRKDDMIRFVECTANLYMVLDPMLLPHYAIYLVSCLLTYLLTLYYCNYSYADLRISYAASVRWCAYAHCYIFTDTRKSEVNDAEENHRQCVQARTRAPLVKDTFKCLSLQPRQRLRTQT